MIDNIDLWPDYYAVGIDGTICVVPDLPHSVGADAALIDLVNRLDPLVIQVGQVRVWITYRHRHMFRNLRRV